VGEKNSTAAGIRGTIFEVERNLRNEIEIPKQASEQSQDCLKQIKFGIDT
jgi:hypothetical protein